MDHNFDVMKFVKENDAKIQRHHEKIQQLEQKQKDLNYQAIYRNYPPRVNDPIPEENLPRKNYNLGQGEEGEEAQYTYELDTRPEHMKQSVYSKESNIRQEYGYTPIDPIHYKGGSAYSNNNNSYLSNQRIGYATNYNNNDVNSSASANNLNEAMKSSESAFAASKLSYDQSSNLFNSNSQGLGGNIIHNQMNMKNEINTLGSSPLSSEKRSDGQSDEEYQQQQEKFRAGNNQRNMEDNDDINEMIKKKLAQGQMRLKNNDSNEMIGNSNGHYNQMNPEGDQIQSNSQNSNADLNNVRNNSSQNTVDSRIDTKKSKKKTTPRFSSLNDDEGIEDGIERDGNLMYQQGEHNSNNNNAFDDKYNQFKAERLNQKKAMNKNMVMNKYPNQNTASTINTKKKYNGKMDTVSRMQQYNEYWTKRPFLKKTKTTKEPQLTAESRLKMNKLGFLTQPLRYYTKM